MVPLVFKTSLGVVRFPEGSTPSLLRQLFSAIDEDTGNRFARDYRGEFFDFSLLPA